MLSFERQQQILQVLKERRCATVDYLCQHLYASGATIRRDLQEMAEKGLVTRVRGGAALIEGTNQDAPPLVRVNKEKEKKEYIARLALRFVSDSATLFMDSSSTVTYLAAKMEGFRGVSVVTNGLPTLNMLNERTTAKVLVCGGVLKNNSSIVGQEAVDLVESFRADILFFSCCGLSLDWGTTEASEDNTKVKKAMCKNAKRRVLLCDSTKFDQEYFCRACPIQDLDVIITDQKPSKEFLNGVGCEVIY